MGQPMWLPLLFFGSLLCLVVAHAADKRSSLDGSVDQAHTWNRFVDALYKTPRASRVTARNSQRTESRRLRRILGWS
jgi:hypothetical protein